MKLKYLSIFIILFSIEINYAQYTDLINSNRPGESMSAFSVGKTVLQFESGLSFLNEKHNRMDYKASGYGIGFDARYGFLKEELEAIIEIDYQKDKYTTSDFSKNRSGLKNTTLGAKYLFYDPYKKYEKKINLYSWKANHKFEWRQLIPAIAAYGGVNLNFDDKFVANPDDNKKISFKAMLITQNQLGSGFVLVTNIFADKIASKYMSLEYIITLTKGFNSKWSGFLENKAMKSDIYSDLIFRSGAAYLINENLQIDASLSKNFKETPSIFYGGIGVSWRYTSNYEEILLRVEKKEKKKDKSVKGKEKEKTKKRLDEIEVTKP